MPGNPLKECPGCPLQTPTSHKIWLKAVTLLCFTVNPWLWYCYLVDSRPPYALPVVVTLHYSEHVYNSTFELKPINSDKYQDYTERMKVDFRAIRDMIKTSTRQPWKHLLIRIFILFVSTYLSDSLVKKPTQQFNFAYFYIYLIKTENILTSFWAVRQETVLLWCETAGVTTWFTKSSPAS